MERKHFIVSEYAKKISSCRDKLFALYRTYGCEDEILDIKRKLDSLSDDKMIRMVFIGQYSAGKSTIISALTGDTTIKIDPDIATDTVKDYKWTGGVLLTDTPGLHTGNREHDQRAIEMIDRSDLLVYCITSDLFNPETKSDFERWAFEKNYFGKMFLVVNKMSKEAGEYHELTKNYAETMDHSLQPHSISKLPCAFVDAWDYREGIECEDEELIDFSHFEEFIAQLNRFIEQKGQLGKLDTPIQILKSSIDKMTEKSVNSEQDRAYLCLLSRIEDRVDRCRSKANREIRKCIREKLCLITDRGNELSRLIGTGEVNFTEYDFAKLIEETCEALNEELGIITQRNMDELNSKISEVMNSEQASFFFNAVGGDVAMPKHLFENRQVKINRAQFEAINDVVNKVAGQMVQIAVKDGNTVGGFFIKAGEAANAPLHNAVKLIGGKLGYKFRPWEAVNIAKNIGNVAKLAGPVAGVLAVLIDATEVIGEAREPEKIARKQIEFRQAFFDYANDLEAQYIEQTNVLFESYSEITEKIAANRAKVQKTIADQDAMAKQLAVIKLDLIDIQTAIF